MAKRQIPRTTEQRDKRKEELFESLSQESDRGLVLVGACFLEEELEGLLRAAFNASGVKPDSIIEPLFDPFGPLANFSAKIKLSRALNLIDDYIYDDLEKIRKLRNIFAHSVGAKRFDFPEVVRLTEKLEAPNRAVTAMSKRTVQATPRNQGGPEDIAQKQRSPKAAMERTRVTLAISWIGATLYYLIEHPHPAIRLRVANV